MSGLPTGLYQPGCSMMHRLNPCVKLIALLLMLAAVVTTDTVYGYAVVLAVTAAAVALSRMPISTALQAVGRLKWFFLLIFLMNTCFYGPENPWVRLWIFQPSWEGMVQGIHVVARVCFLLVLSNVLTVTTAPLAMTGAMETLLSPLRFVGLPVGQIAMILSVAIQFIPTLLEETDQIRKAQIARGARFDSPKLVEKAKAVLPLLVPIFLAAFKRADELSLAMEARGYRSSVRYARKKTGPFGRNEVFVLLVCLLFCAVQILVL